MALSSGKKQRTNTSDTTTSSHTHKIEALDSVRGIAAFSVVFWHFASIFFPAAIGARVSTAHTGSERWLYESPLAALYSGSFAVSLFFILSGFVLTLRFFSGKQTSLFPAAMKRYFRLMPIALASVLISYGLLALGLYTNVKLHAGITESPWMGSAYFAFDPNFLTALWQGVLGVFATQVGADITYNPVLWTIYYEMLGSLLIFGLATLCRGHSKRWILYGIALLAFIDTNFAGFIVGMVLADLYATVPTLYARIEKLPIFYQLSAFALAFAIGSYPSIDMMEDKGKYWNMLTLSPGDEFVSRTILQLAAGTILIVLALTWRKLRHILEHRILLWLGRVSYALYAVHLIILYSLTVTLFTVFTRHFELSYVSAAFLALACTIPVIFALSALLHTYLEKPSIALANRIGTWGKTKSNN